MSIYDKASLVLIPSGTKTSKVYSQKPVNGDGDFTFSRSTAATRVNASGNIEKETQNLLVQSNNFDSVSWLNYQLTRVGGQSGYDGSNDAWVFTKTATGFANIRQAFTAISGVYTYSAYIKAGTNTSVIMRCLGTSDHQWAINLSNGTSLSPPSNIIDTKIEDIGSGWYRCSMAFNANAVSNTYFYPEYPFNGTTAGSIYVQDAQLNQGLIAQEVITTTTTALYGGITDNVPRLDYTDSSCPALLLEPQRTNIVDYSELFTSASTWGVINIGTRTANYGTSPEGVQNSTRLVLNNTTDAHIFRNAGGLADGTDYVFSCWYKGTAGQTAYIRAITSGTNNTSTYKLITFTGEWQREFTAFKAGSTYNYVYPVDARAGSMNASDFEIFGAQLEAGSYATSYIPTYGTSVTRNQDNNLKSSAASIIGQTEGTLFLDFEFINPNKIVVLFTIHDNANNKRLELWANNNVLNGFIGGSVNIAIGNTTITNGRHKAAIAYDESGDQAFYVDGVQIGTSSTAYTIASLTSIRFDHWGGFGTYKAKEGVKQTLLFKTRLSNEELAALTTI